MFEDVIRSLAKPFGIARAEQRVQKNVVGFESGVGLEFTAPVSFFMLLWRIKVVARRQSQRLHGLPDHQSSQSAVEARLEPMQMGREFFHSYKNKTLVRAGTDRGCAGNGLNNFRRQSETNIFGHDFNFLNIVEAFAAQNLTTSSTRHSGAEAPAVRAIVLTSCNHSGWMLRKLSIKWEAVPRFLATSTRRLEFELLSDPTTRSRSASEATCFTATWRFSVA